MHLRHIFTYWVLCLIAVHLLPAQPVDSLPGDPVITQVPAPDGAIYSLKNPREAVSRHLYYLSTADYQPEIAADVIYGDIDEAEKIRMAIQLRDIFDAKGDFVNVALIPDNPNYRDSTSGNQEYVIFPNKYPGIYVKKYGDNWYYSASTLRDLPSIYRSVIPPVSQWLQDLFPSFGQRRFLGMKIWKYLGFILILGLAYLVYRLLDWVFIWVIRRLLPTIFPDSAVDRKLIRRAAHPLSFLLVALLVREYALPILILPIGMGRPAFILISIFASAVGVFFFLRLVDVFADVFRGIASRTDTTMDDQLVPLLSKTAKLIVIVFGILFILDNLDVNVTALLAGVSIGGLALALAAQDTARNFIGSITLFVDRPFVIGDFIDTGSMSGTVTEVGVRSTRLRASDGAQISLPNGELANKTITNHGIRTYRRYATTLGITYDTPRDTIAAFVEGVRDIASAHPLSREDSVVVQFHEMADSSLNLFFAVIYETTDHATWLKARQEVFLEIMGLAEKLGVSFAFPSRSVYVESMPKS